MLGFLVMEVFSAGDFSNMLERCFRSRIDRGSYTVDNHCETYCEASGLHRFCM